MINNYQKQQQQNKISQTLTQHEKRKQQQEAKYQRNE